MTHEQNQSSPLPFFDKRANAERLVSCVNALEGVSNPAAVKQLIEALQAVWKKIEYDMPKKELMGENGKLLIGFTMLDIHKIHSTLAALDTPVPKTEEIS